MEDLTPEFIEVKIAALSKSKFVSDYLDKVSQLATKFQQNEEPRIVEKPVKHDLNSSTMNTNIRTDLAFKQLLTEMEFKRQHSVQQTISNKMKEINDMERKRVSKRRSDWAKQQEKLLNRMQQQELHILQTLEQHDRDSLKKHEQLVQYYQELAEKRKENDKAIKAKEEKHQRFHRMLDKVNTTQAQFRAIYLEIIQYLKDLDESVKKALVESINTLKFLPAQMDELVAKVKGGKFNEEEVNVKCSELMQLSEKYKNEVADKINEHRKNQEVHKKMMEEQLQQQQKQLQETQQQERPPPREEIPFKTSIYQELLMFQDALAVRLEPLLEDPNFKTFRFDCKKAVNIPVNALSAVRADHLLDKYNKLHNLLSGKTVQIGDTQVTASSHPQGVPFCMHLLAKKFVLQGDLMISSNPEAAFYYSSIIIALWTDFPDFGKLLLARFYTVCPYTIPLYIQRLEGQSDESYYTSLGYQYKDGAVEKQDKFLKRVTGIFRLYFSLLITKPKQRLLTSPHNICNGWFWISSVLNLEPEIDITATGILVFLEVVGWAMEQAYGQQFKKIVHYIGSNFIEKLRKKDSGGPVARLEMFLQSYHKRGFFEKPKGILPNNFW